MDTPQPHIPNAHRNPVILPPSVPHLIPPPPITEEELGQVKAQQEEAAKDPVRSILIKNFDTSFIDDFIKLLPEGTGPAFRPLLETLWHDCDILVLREKLLHGRLRPYTWAKKHNISFTRHEIATHKNPSYPSFHAAAAKIFAFTLSQILPSRSHLFHQLASSVGQSRIDGGVHFPSDVEAGFQWAEMVWKISRQGGLRVEKLLSTENLFK